MSTIKITIYAVYNKTWLARRIYIILWQKMHKERSLRAKILVIKLCPRCYRWSIKSIESIFGNIRIFNKKH